MDKQLILSKHINSISREEWVFLYVEEGLSLPEIAVCLGTTPKTIYSRLMKLGIPTRAPGRRAPTPLTEDILREAYEVENYNLTRAALSVGLSAAQFKKQLKHYGVTLKRKASEVLTYEYLQGLVDKGVSPSAIAIEAGLSAPIVYRYLYKFGFRDKHAFSKVERKCMSEVVSLYELGNTMVEISSKVGKSVGYVADALYSFGVTIEGTNRRTMKIDPEIAVSLYKEGKSLEEIRVFFGGGGKDTIVQALNSAGVKVRSKSEALHGPKNHMHGKRHTKEARSKMSDAYAQQVRTVVSSPRGNEEEVLSPLQGIICVRSSWEAAVARFFNSGGVAYLYEDHPLVFFAEGVRFSYTPDFLLLGGRLLPDKYIEVKGQWTDEARYKVETAISAGYNIEVWDGRYLQDLGILDHSFRPAL